MLEWIAGLSYESWAAIGGAIAVVIVAFVKRDKATGENAVKALLKRLFGVGVILLALTLPACAQTSWGPYGSGMNVGSAVGTYIKAHYGPDPGFEIQTGANQVADANEVTVAWGDKSLTMKGVHFSNNASDVREAAALQAQQVPAILDAQGRVVTAVFDGAGRLVGYIGSAGSQLIGAQAAGQATVIGAKANAAVSIIDTVGDKLAGRIKTRLERAVAEEADRILPEPTTQPTTQPVE